MAKFLDTVLFSEWIIKLIEQTDKELVILVPFINISEKIYEKLKEANSRNVETLIVYRENQLQEKVRTKLSKLDNLNLLHHPTLHAKCYYNEKYLILGSMNLYSHSELNNREMGVLLHRDSITEAGIVIAADEDTLFKDAILEMREIINSSELEFPSRDTVENGFELEIIKTDIEKTLETCANFNKHFVNKNFKPVEISGKYYPVCSNYYNKIDVCLDSRITLYFNLPDYHLKNMVQEFSGKYNEYMYEGFKFYWNFPYTKAILYYDRKHILWSKIDQEEFEYNSIKKVLAQFISDIKPMMVIK